MRTPLLLLLLLFLPGAWAGPAVQPQAAPRVPPIPVRIWVGGDTGTDQHLHVALRKEFGRSPHFTLDPPSEALQVVIPENSRVEPAGAGRRVSFQFRLVTAGHLLESGHGECWEGRYQDCAAIVVRSAERALATDDPCTVRRQDVYVNLSYRDCLDLAPAERMRGIWLVDREYSVFLPSATALPAVWPLGTERIWLDPDKGEVERFWLCCRFGPHAAAIDFIGRRSRRPGRYGHLGMNAHAVVVDRVIGFRPLPVPEKVVFEGD